MNIRHYDLLFSSALLLAACDPATVTDAGTDAPRIDSGLDAPVFTDTGTDTGSGLSGRDNPPTLGAQIDRAGRPAITAATVGTFLADAPRSTLRDAYNADTDATTWAADYTASIASSIAILDALDTVCGNQTGAGAMPIAGRYDTLAGVLANDRLMIDSASGSCVAYLGVEAEALGIVPEGGCGGRPPSYDVIRTSYSVLVNGSLGDIDDGVAADSATHSDDAFPFLAAP